MGGGVVTKTCNTCQYAIFHDYGWSNWTVEGTYFSCARSLHPDGTFDRWYSEDERLNYGAKCSGYVKGDPIGMDVEGEDEGKLTPDQRIIWDAWKAEIRDDS